MPDEMHPELVELLSTIQATGFTQLQAKAYISLLKEGEATGSAIAAAANINRSKIYDILNDLETMGAISRLSRDNKPKYVAKDPEIVFADILDRFTQKLDDGKDALKEIRDVFQLLDENVATLTSINLKEFDVNQFDILISSDERTRTKFVEKIPEENRPKDHVLLLNLNIGTPPELIFLIGIESVMLVNNVPGFVLKDVLLLEGKIFSSFFRAIVQSAWERDFPDDVFIEMQQDKRRVLFTGKALWMQHTTQGGLAPREYTRPVSFLISDTHLSFFHENIEDHKIPIHSISKVEVEGEDLVSCELANMRTGQKFGELSFRVVSRAIIVKNIITTVSKQIQN